MQTLIDFVCRNCGEFIALEDIDLKTHVTTYEGNAFLMHDKCGQPIIFEKREINLD